MAGAGWGSLPEELAADVRRVADRLRGVSQARLGAAAPPFTSRADAARLVAAHLARAAQGLAARAGDVEPQWRMLPLLSDFAVGDQVAVTGHDLLAGIDECPADAQVWVPGARRLARDCVTDAVAALAATRGLL